MNQVESMNKEFKAADYLAIITVLVASWSYVWLCIDHGGIYWLVFAVIYIGAGIIYAIMNKRTISKESGLYALFIIAASICLAFIGSDISMNNAIAYEFEFPLLVFYHGFGVYFIMTINNNRIDDCLDERSVIDMLRGVFAIPFRYFIRLAQAIISGVSRLFNKAITGERKHGKKIEQIVIGISLGFFILLIAIPILMSAEESFSNFVWTFGGHLIKIMEMLFDNIDFRFICMILVASYLYGLLYGANVSKTPLAIHREPKYTLAAVTCQVVVCSLYALFFVVKFVDVLQKVNASEGGLVYSEYAREGFFELCFIAFLNVLIYYLIRYMSEWKNKKIKVLSTVLSVETLAFIILAFYKMNMYITAYGYTFKRIITSWFMVVLFVGFILFIYQTWRKFNAIRITVWFGSISFLATAYMWCVVK
ncbi:MAG: DUF4173 domain-containing protein [Suipraeoptans sp.]